MTMNLPYTISSMPPNEAADCVKAFAPKIVYPYHYRGSDLSEFTASLKERPEIEVFETPRNPPTVAGVVLEPSPYPLPEGEGITDGSHHRISLTRRLANLTAGFISPNTTVVPFPWFSFSVPMTGTGLSLTP